MTDNDKADTLIPPKKKMKRAERQVLLNEMIAGNVKSSVIAKSLNYSMQHVSRAKSNLLKNPLLKSKLIKQSVKNVEHFNIANYEKDNRIKPSDVLHASEIVLDRAFPKVSKSESVSIQINSDIDMSKYINNKCQIIEHDTE